MPTTNGNKRKTLKTRIFTCVILGGFITLALYLFALPLILKTALLNRLDNAGFPNAHTTNMSADFEKMTLTDLSLTPDGQNTLRNVIYYYNGVAHITSGHIQLQTLKATATISTNLHSIYFDTLAIPSPIPPITTKNGIFRKNQNGQWNIKADLHATPMTSDITAQITGHYSPTSDMGEYMIELLSGHVSAPYILHGKRLTGWLSGTYTPDKGFTHNAEIGLGTLEILGLTLRAPTLTYSQSDQNNALIIRGQTTDRSHVLIDAMHHIQNKNITGIIDVQDTDTENTEDAKNTQSHTPFQIHWKQGLLRINTP